MALQVSRKGKERIQEDDPTESLKESIRRFQEVLTEEQRKRFKDSAAVPDAEGVLYFVAKLDAENSSNTRRSIAPRLCNFLSATQQFAGALETFVSSNPSIAALVWGGVKTAITVASNVASYFDKITNMIMEIGIFCPTFQDFGHIYHGHVGLQNALSNYYAVIVDLCVKIIEVSRRSFAKQTLSAIWTPFEAEFKPLIDRLSSIREQIDLQISLASAQAGLESKRLLEHGNREDESFRPSVLGFLRKSSSNQEETRQWQLNQTKREVASLKTRIRHNLSSLDHMRPWKRNLKQRVHLTAEWLTKESIFLEWRNSSETAIFWCSGTMGMGKTVLMSSVVSHLHSSRTDNAVISHFFCSSDTEESLTARSIFGSICRQLLDTFIERSEHESLISLESDSQGLDTSEIVDFLVLNLDPQKTYYIVLDGLDECKPTQVREIDRAFATLCHGINPKIKILCAGRPDLEEDLFKRAKPQYRLVIDKEKLSVDIDRYIASSLHNCFEEGLLLLSDPSIINKIVSVLHKGSRGMFLWASLCIADLCEMNCDQDILHALEHLPRGLAELFDSKIRRIQEREDASGTRSMKILQYCGVVKRPLTLEEYREALAISADDTLLDIKRMPNNMNRIVRGCHGLLFVDEEEHTIHYIHQSVKDHFFSSRNQHPPKFDEHTIDENMGLLCMTYLNFSNFSRQIAKVDKAAKTVFDPLQVGTFSVSANEPLAHKIMQNLLPKKDRQSRMKFRDFEKAALQGVEDIRSRAQTSQDGMQSFAFLSYAKAHWCLHLKKLKAEEGSQIWSLFCKCVGDEKLPLDRPWKSPTNVLLPPGLDPDKSSRTMRWIEEQVPSFVERLSASTGCIMGDLIWTFEQDHYALFLYFMKLGSPHPDSLIYENRCPIFLNGNTHLWAKVLIQFERSPDFWASCLCSVAKDSWAPEAKRIELALAVLDQMADYDPATAGLAFKMALKRAIWNDRIFRLILSIYEAFWAAKVNFIDEFPKGDDETSIYNPRLIDPFLSDVLRSPDTKAKKRLFKVGASINIRDESGDTYLTTAVKNRDHDMVERLLAAGADANVRGKLEKTPLHLAVMNRQIKIAKVLLDAGADVNSRDSSSLTALHFAVVPQELERSFDGVFKADLSKLRNKGQQQDRNASFENSMPEHLLSTLLMAGADWTLKTDGGLTAENLAMDYKQYRVAEYLQLEGSVPGLVST